MRDAGGVGRAQVRVAAFPSAAAGLLPGATRELRTRRPDAELTLQVLEEEPALDALLAGRVDVATVVRVRTLPVQAAPGRRVPADLRRRAARRGRVSVRARKSLGKHEPPKAKPGRR